MENNPLLEEQVRRILASDFSRVTIIHCLPNIVPLILLRKRVGTEIKKFTERTTILKRGNFIYGWDNEGVVTELYDKDAYQIVLQGLVIRRVENRVAFNEYFGIGESMSTLAAAAQYPIPPAGTSTPRQ